MKRPFCLALLVSLWATIATGDTLTVPQPAVLPCLHNTGVVQETDYKPYHLSRWIELNTDTYVLSGQLGWHISWGVLLDQSTNPPSAYETIKAEGLGRAFGQSETPPAIIIALRKCGVAWQGDWLGPIPSRKHIADRQAPSPLNSVQNFDLRPAQIESLLPSNPTP